VIEQIKAAKLRGRGGAGYLTGNKWEFLYKAPGPEKYLICNADEGDPGAYMNRNEIESDPQALIEGMLIAGYVTGASAGSSTFEPSIPSRCCASSGRSRRPGTMASSAATCSDAASTSTSSWSKAPAPSCAARRRRSSRRSRALRPPAVAPAVPGAEGPVRQAHQHQQRRDLVQHRAHRLQGARLVHGDGSTKSAGTKVFSLVGKVKSTGLVEMPLGTPLAKFIYDIGGGTTSGREIKAVQTGGPSGGCIPVDMFDTPVDYETLQQLGSIMGSGGMVVMDEDNCMVDVARYFIEFTTRRAAASASRAGSVSTRPCASSTASRSGRPSRRTLRRSTSCAG